MRPTRARSERHRLSHIEHVRRAVQGHLSRRNECRVIKFALSSPIATRVDLCAAGRPNVPHRLTHCDASRRVHSPCVRRLLVQSNDANRSVGAGGEYRFGNGVMWALTSPTAYCSRLHSCFGSGCRNVCCRQLRPKALSITDFLPNSRSGSHAILVSVETL